LLGNRFGKLLNEKEMEILLVLESQHATLNQNTDAFIKPIKINWDLPFVPNVGDIFDCESFIEVPDCFVNLSWHVDYRVFEKIDGKIFLRLCLLGE
jgi:hypothetical protein